MTPKVSVILPIYNVEKYLGRCLDSILAQTFRDYEIICVNDCGTDGSMDIVRKYQKQYADRIRIIESQQNAGLGGARDKGIAAAEGQYLAFVDSDDAIAADYLEEYIKAAEENTADIVAGGSTRIEGEKRTANPGMPEDPWYCWVNVSAWAKVFRAAFLQKHNINFRGVRTYEDAPFLYRCLAESPRITVIRSAGYFYYQNPGSITTGRRADRIRLYEDFETNMTGMYRENTFAEQDREILTYCMASQLITNLLFNGQHAGRKKMVQAYRSLHVFLKMLDPELRHNSFVGRKKPLAEPSLNSLATGVVLRLRRIKLDYPLFVLVSILPRIV